jgi:hypothetical protein
MRTAINTNLLSALWSKEPSASDIARNLVILPLNDPNPSVWVFEH